jgi:protein-disulfide isomerase
MDEQTTQTTTPVVQVQKNNALAIPIAIVFGFALIAGAIFFSSQNAQKANVAVDPKDAIEQASGQIGKTGPVRPVDENDHIKGNPNAPIVIVEYSDFDCPFCKNFHETMNAVMDTYGAEGKVAWVYRQFPLEQLHPNAPTIAQASECVADLGGNDAFWKFSDRVFGERGVNEPTDITRLTEFATAAGVSENAYKSCMEDGRTRPAVEEDFKDGINAGAKGTPYSLVLVGGQQGVINGAQKFEYVKSVLDTLIEQMEGKTETAG